MVQRSFFLQPRSNRDVSAASLRSGYLAARARGAPQHQSQPEGNLDGEVGVERPHVASAQIQHSHRKVRNNRDQSILRAGGGTHGNRRVGRNGSSPRERVKSRPALRLGIEVYVAGRRTDLSSPQRVVGGDWDRGHPG